MATGEKSVKHIIDAVSKICREMVMAVAPFMVIFAFFVVLIQQPASTFDKVGNVGALLVCIVGYSRYIYDGVSAWWKKNV